MTVRIRHENLRIVLMLIAVFLLLCGLACVCIVKYDLPEIICMLILLYVTVMMLILEQTVRTAVTVDEEAVTARFLFLKKRMAFSEMRDVRLERYTRRRKNHFKEQRLRMTVSGENGKKFVLTDSAMAHNGGIMFSRYAVLPDEEVPLYGVYRCIQEKLNSIQQH